MPQLAQLAPFEPPSTDPLASSVVLYLKGGGPLSGGNSNYSDSSSFSRPISVVGNPINSSVSPFSFGYSYGGSTWFNGTTDYLRTSNTSADFHWSTSAFTLEWWMQPSRVDVNQGILGTFQANSATLRGWRASLNTNGSLSFLVSTTQTTNDTISTPAGSIVAGTWYHVAIVGNGTSVTVYLNGVAAASGTQQPTSGTGTLYVAINSDQTPGVQWYYTGSLSNVRLITSRALYTAAFTPPSVPLIDLYNSAILLRLDAPSIADMTRQFAYETRGNASFGLVTPSNTTRLYNTTSIRFNGTTSTQTGTTYIQPQTGYAARASDPFSLGSGAFTVDFWINPSGTLPATGAGAVIFSYGKLGSPSTLEFSIYINSAGAPVALLRGWFTNSSAFSALTCTSSRSLSSGVWQHVALTRDSSGLIYKWFINGVEVAATFPSTNYASTTVRNIRSDSTDPATSGMGVFLGGVPTGYSGMTLRDINAHIDEFRVTRGTARNFTATVAPTPSLTGTTVATPFQSQIVTATSLQSLASVPATPTVNSVVSANQISATSLFNINRTDRVQDSIWS